MSPVFDVSSYAEYLRKTYGEAISNNYLSLQKAKNKQGYKYFTKKRLLIIVWNNQHKTIKEWAEELNISHWAFIRRIKLFGITERAFWPKGKREVDNRNQLLTFEGVTMTALEWAKYCRVTWGAFYQRLRRFEEGDPRIFCQGYLQRGARHKKLKREV